MASTMNDQSATAAHTCTCDTQDVTSQNPLGRVVECTYMGEASEAASGFVL
jgi:hypothetical protein